MGTYVRDREDRVGRVMDVSGATVWLRPPRGGTEWTASVGQVEPVSAGEALGVAVREANRRAKWFRPARG
ncbi:hypothetical protein [Streptomyces capparidis]